MTQLGTPTDVTLHDGTVVSGIPLTDVENLLLDQLLNTVAGTNENMQILVEKQRPYIEYYLMHLKYKYNQPFVGMRQSNEALAGVPLSPQHLDTGAIGWANNPGDASTPQWKNRATDDGTTVMDGNTIATDIYPCIIGLFHKQDMTATTTTTTTYAEFFDRVKFKVTNTEYLPLDLYSAGTIAADRSARVVYVPFLPVPSESTFTEKYWVSGGSGAGTTHDSNNCFLGLIGVTFGIGSKLTNIGM